MSNHHDQDQNINSKDFLLGTLLGGIIGASVALLFAPKSGKELRQDINNGAHYVRERAEEWKDVAYVKGSEWRDVAREKTDQFSSAFSEKTKTIGDKVKETKSQIQDKVAQFRTKDDTDQEEAIDLADAIENAENELNK